MANARPVRLADLERQLKGDYVRDVESLPANISSMFQNSGALLGGLASIPGTVAGYLSNRSLPEIAGDVGGFAVDVASGLVSDPMQSMLETFNVPGMAADLGEIRSNAATLRDMGMPEEANQLEQLAAVSLASFAVPGVGNKTRPAVRAGARAATEAAEAAAPAVSNFAVGRVSDPIRAYHGSPYAFDRFDINKIGTGEGNQGFGRGIYLSEDSAIGRGYQTSISAMKRLLGEDVGDVLINGREIDWDNPIEAAAFEAARYGGDRAAAADYVLRQFGGRSRAADVLLSPAELPDVTLPGHLYEVNINADKGAFADLNAPLSDQHRSLQDFARGADLSRLKEGTRTRVMLEKWLGGTEQPGYRATVGDLHSALSDYGKLTDDMGFSEFLKNSGYPGIRYREMGITRSGDKPSNYVVFDPDILEIRRRYREGGGVGSSDFAVRPQSDIGAQIDTTRPILDNPDGSFSTERTITIEADGRFFNIPTIVGGRQRSEEEAIRLWQAGKNSEVGVFNTLEDALSTARRRSSEIGTVRSRVK